MQEMITPPIAVEAVLFAVGAPLEKKRLATLLSVSPSELQMALTALRTDLEGRGVVLVETDTEVELRTSPDASTFVAKLRESELSRDLGKAGLETLATIAYGKGATRSEVDWVRGVNSSTSIRSLLLRGLIEGSEDPTDRRRIKYTLTTEALAHLGISQPVQLPRFEELSSGAKEVIESEGAKTEA